MKFIFTEIMGDQRRIERDISRRQVKINDLRSEIQRLEHFLGGKKNYLACLKETLVQENIDLQQKEELLSSLDSKYVSLSVRYICLVKDVTS